MVRSNYEKIRIFVAFMLAFYVIFLAGIIRYSMVTSPEDFISCVSTSSTPITNFTIEPKITEPNSSNYKLEDGRLNTSLFCELYPGKVSEWKKAYKQSLYIGYGGCLLLFPVVWYHLERKKRSREGKKSGN